MGVKSIFNYSQVVLMRFMAFSNYLRVHMFVILPSFAEITEINTRENIQELYVHVINCWIGYFNCA